MTTAKLITGILAATAAGALLGILFAPDSGSATRQRIAKKSGDISDAVKDKYNNMKKSMANKQQGIRNDAAELMEKGIDQLQHA